MRRPLVQRLLTLLVVVVAAIFVNASPAFADFAPWNTDLTEQGYGAVEENHYCKDISEASKEEREYFLEIIQQSDIDDDYKERAEEQGLDSDEFFGGNICFDTEDQEACLAFPFDSFKDCFATDGEQEPVTGVDEPDWLDDPIGTASNTAAENLAEQIAAGMVYAMFWLLTRWLEAQSLEMDLSENAAQVFFPQTLWLGMFIGFLLLLWQAVRMMFQRKPEVLFSLVRGLLIFVAFTVCGVAVMGGLIGASDEMTSGLIDYTYTIDDAECEESDAASEFDEEDYPDDQSHENFVKCATSSADMLALESIGATIIFGIIGLVMMLIQFILLFIRESALPLIALMIPIAASGQIGGKTTQKWLPGLLSLAMTIILYKPMVALIMAVGFSQAAMPSHDGDFIRGFATLALGVVAPAILMKAFQPMMNNAIESGAGMGNTANTLFLAQQSTSQIGHSVQNSAANRAERKSEKETAKQAEKAAAQTAAATATGGTSLLLSAGERTTEKGVEAAKGGTEQRSDANSGTRKDASSHDPHGDTRESAPGGNRPSAERSGAMDITVRDGRSPPSPSTRPGAEHSPGEHNTSSLPDAPEPSPRPHPESRRWPRGEQE